MATLGTRLYTWLRVANPSARTSSATAITGTGAWPRAAVDGAGCSTRAGRRPRRSPRIGAPGSTARSTSRRAGARCPPRTGRSPICQPDRHQGGLSAPRSRPAGRRARRGRRAITRRGGPTAERSGDGNEITRDAGGRGRPGRGRVFLRLRLRGRPMSPTSRVIPCRRSSTPSAGSRPAMTSDRRDQGRNGDGPGARSRVVRGPGHDDDRPRHLPFEGLVRHRFHGNLLGGSYISIRPGGGEEAGEGYVFTRTQGSIDLMEVISRWLFGGAAGQ